jgi:hypothetical protein
MKKQIALLIVLAIAASSTLTAGPVESSKDVTPTPPPENPWSFTLTPYGWMTSIDGTMSAGDHSADVDIAFKDVLKHLDMGVMMAAELRYKRWGFLGDLIYARLHDDIAPPAGILYSSTHEVLKETLVTLELSYRVVDSKPAFLDVFAGARIYNFYSQIVLRPSLVNPNPGVNASGTETWADPIFGLRGRYYVSRAVFLNFYGDIGGFGAGSDLSWQVLGGIGIQASHWCDVELGYRALGFDYEPGRTKQDITTHGPIIGAIIHF